MKEKRENEETNSSNKYNNSDTEIQESLLNYPSLETNPTHTYNTETEPKKVQTKSNLDKVASSNLTIIIPDESKIQISKFPTNPDLHQEAIERSSPFPMPYPLGIKSITNSDLYQARMSSKLPEHPSQIGPKHKHGGQNSLVICVQNSKI